MYRLSEFAGLFADLFQIFFFYNNKYALVNKAANGQQVRKHCLFYAITPGIWWGIFVHLFLPL